MFITFILGIVIGLFLRDIKCDFASKFDEAKKKSEGKGQAQFIEPESIEESLKKAKELSDFIK